MSKPELHLYLIGFMGTGKSAVGPLVAKCLHRTFYDLDEVIATVMRRSIKTIFETEGEKAFRQYETEMLQTIVGSEAAVIALGGGAPTVPAIAQTLRTTGRIALLTADWRTIWDRVKDNTSRPLLADVTEDRGANVDGAFARFAARAKSILQPRLAVYHALADFTVDTSSLSIEAVANRITEYARTLTAADGGGI